MFGKLLTLSKIHSVVCLMLMLGMMAIMGRPTQVMAADNVLPNPGFEEGIKDWSIGEGDSLVTEEAARTGKYGLRVTNNGMKAKGSNASSARFEVTPGLEFSMTFWARADDTSAGIYFMYLNEKGRMVSDPDVRGGLPMIRIKSNDKQWHEYTLKATAPKVASKVMIWVHTFSSATCVIDLDDFVVSGFPEDVKIEIPKPYKAPAKPKPIDWDNIPKPDKPINIILKLDDLSARGRMPHPRWQKMADYIDSKGVKCTMGMLCYDLDIARPDYIQWVKSRHQSGNWEFWFHGWDHKSYKGDDGKTYNEFHNRTYEQQKKRLSDSQQLAYEKFGFYFTCFGPPGGSGTLSQDAVTHQIMIDDPHITTWLYPTPLDKLGEATNKQGEIVILDRVWGVGIEAAVGAANFEAFVRGYVKNVNKRDYFTLQGHPAMWNDQRFEQFTKIIEFLIEQDANFVLPSEYSATLRKE
ncbi:MAG TPA: polysaccharide deacetylase [Phycisphaerales bacterium]|nr:polysaccharide deacetylase [Phycisphaerales bacterium]HCD31738.1 polysaccharide deacetylase [Phycisphaerales bacterium]|tara:strand:- start:1413 stop:2810 length:1398 start_codon:yes stop_codon:yes gene_type:complete